MPSAGDITTVPTAPGARIATEIITANSSDIGSTETVIHSVEAPVVTGRTYRLRFCTMFSGSNSGDRFDVRIREDNLAGNQLQLKRAYSLINNVHADSWICEVEFTASSSETKTFVVTLGRNGGSGTMRSNGGSSSPGYLYVDYIRG